MLFVGPNEAYPRYLGDLLLVSPEWNSRKKLPDGWERVYEVDPPSHKNGMLKELMPQRLEDGKLYQSWIVVPGSTNSFDPASVFPGTQL